MSVYPPITEASSIAASSGLRSFTKLKNKVYFKFVIVLVSSLSFLGHLLRTAVPAMVRDIMTMRLVKKAKVQKTRWVLDPKRALMTCISRTFYYQTLDLATTW